MNKIIYLTLFLFLPLFFPLSYQEDLDEIIIFQKSALEKINQEKYNDALIILEEIIKIDPDNFFAHNNKAIIFLEQEKYHESLEIFEKALIINPNNTESWNNKGIVHTKLIQYENALDSFYKSIKIDPYNQIAFDNIKILINQFPLYDYSEFGYAIIQVWDDDGHLIGSTKATSIAFSPVIGLEVIKESSTVESITIDEKIFNVIKFHGEKKQFLNEYVGGIDLTLDKGVEKNKIGEISTHGFIAHSGDTYTYDLIVIDP